MKVLVVDDYATMRRIIRNFLAQIGFDDVEEAEDGESAIRKLKSKEFGLVLSDWQMVPMTGLQLLKSVRTDSTLAKMPFILITAESKPENIAAAKQAGANSYIVKPFNADTLKTKIMAALSRVA